jgi:hypothetical protein
LLGGETEFFGENHMEDEEENRGITLRWILGNWFARMMDRTG